MSVIPIEYASQRRIRDRNKLYYRFNHWPIWVFVFFIAPGPLTFDLFERGFDVRMAFWLGAVVVGTGIAGLRGRLPGVEPKPYIIRFTEDRPNPLYRRVCYTFAWSEVITFAVVNIAGLVAAVVTGQWYLKQIYRYAYFPLAGIVWLLGLLGKLPRVKASTKGEGHERRYFYGSVWAVCWAQPTLWLMWKVLPRTRAGDSLKLFIFLAILAFVGHLAYRGRLPRTRPIVPGELAVFGLMAPDRREGWEGWDQYAAFYDWENAQTLGRRDVPFWRRIALTSPGPLLELGCGTGRITLPLARAGVHIVGVDRSAPMLACAARRGCRIRQGGRPDLVRGDIRALPFESNSFSAVLAPYGVLQSLLRDRDLTATLTSVARVLSRGGQFGVDLVPDVPNWREYRDQVQLRGRAAGGAHLTLIESVRQDRARRLTTFEQTYVERLGTKTTKHRFELNFRTLSIRQMTRRLEAAGFAVDRVLGDYRGRPWDAGADVWIILAKKR